MSTICELSDDQLGYLVEFLSIRDVILLWPTICDRTREYLSSKVHHQRLVTLAKLSQFDVTNLPRGQLEIVILSLVIKPYPCRETSVVNKIVNYSIGTDRRVTILEYKGSTVEPCVIDKVFIDWNHRVICLTEGKLSLYKDGRLHEVEQLCEPSTSRKAVGYVPQMSGILTDDFILHVKNERIRSISDVLMVSPIGSNMIDLILSNRGEVYVMKASYYIGEVSKTSLHGIIAIANGEEYGMALKCDGSVSVIQTNDRSTRELKSPTLIADIAWFRSWGWGEEIFMILDINGDTYQFYESELGDMWENGEFVCPEYTKYNSNTQSLMNCDGELVLVRGYDVIKVTDECHICGRIACLGHDGLLSFT